MKVASFFSGCGGLDLGFKKAGFDIVWANDNAKGVWETFEKNFPDTFLCKKSIRKIDIDEIPDDIAGIIGGPPCQSWSAAGKRKGINDKRGLLFFDYINIIEQKQPLFFVAENVQGLLAKRNKEAFELIQQMFKDAGYNLRVMTLNAADYDVPQNRKRIFFVGYRYDIDKVFSEPIKTKKKPTVKKAIFDIKDFAIPSSTSNQSNKDKCLIPNHEYWVGSYSYIFMSRNRVLSWEGQSYTIQASGRQMSIHPQAPLMEKVQKDVMTFKKGFEDKYRRLTIRECARIQTFPDKFKFYYDSLDAGYKMIGNSVPVNLGYAIAKKIYQDISEFVNEAECIQNTVSKQQSHVHS